MLRLDGYVKVLDFGLAKLTESNFFRRYDPAVTQAETIDGLFDDLYATAAIDDQQTPVRVSSWARSLHVAGTGARAEG